ncbi:MAG TPA: glutaredoxin family protein [Candidatus Acidoferrum sp.]|nr:glutaredoxin family protein [Candidatus Acidoferrum sp.]
MNEHPEDLRLAGAGALDVTLYSRPGCHLCEAAKAAIDPLLSEYGATLHEISIEGDAELTERYGWDIPVLFVGARKAAKHRINVKQLRRQLKEAKEGAGNADAVMVRKKGA